MVFLLMIVMLFLLILADALHPAGGHKQHS